MTTTSRGGHGDAATPAALPPSLLPRPPPTPPLPPRCPPAPRWHRAAHTKATCVTPTPPPPPIPLLPVQPVPSSPRMGQHPGGLPQPHSTHGGPPHPPVPPPAGAGAHVALQKLFSLFPIPGAPPRPPPTPRGGGPPGGLALGAPRWRAGEREQPPQPPGGGGDSRGGGVCGAHRGLHDLVAAADALHEAAGEDDAQDLGGGGKEGRGWSPSCPAPHTRWGGEGGLSPTWGLLGGGGAQPHVSPRRRRCPTRRPPR